MASVSLTDILTLLARLAFVLLLYIFVVSVLFSLRRTIRATAAAAHEPRVPARLVLTEAAPGDGPTGRVVTLDRPLLIGRRPDCDIALRDDSVSGHHAQIAWGGESWQIEDLGSTNGTLVNGQRATRSVALRSGDVIQAGSATWRVELPEA
jgi:hypothetical protein